MPEKKVSYRFLKFPDLSQGYGAGSESVRLFDSTAVLGWGGFSDGFVGQLLSRGFRTRILACGLLSSCHSLEYVSD